MTFEQLRYFTEIYRQKSITRAADNLFISRPALSAMLKNLEQEFHITLFQRLPQGVVATAAGDAFYRYAQAILQTQAALNQEMLHFSNGSKEADVAQPRCVISLPQSLIGTYGASLLEHLSGLFPRTYFEITTNNPARANEFYKNSDINLAVLSENIYQQCQLGLDEPYMMRLLTTWPIYIRTAATSPLAQEKRLTLDVIKQYPYCALKNTFNGLGFADVLEQGEIKTAQIELEKNFCDYVKKFQYFTIDLMINGSFMFDKQFPDRSSVVLKQTEEQFFVVLIYQKTLDDYYSILADFFQNI